MKSKDLSEAPQYVRDAYAALLRAADMARQVAIQTNTAIVIVQDGQLRRITAEELRQGAANPIAKQAAAQT
ncbi:MAG: hypothetical protein JSS31_15395 [Proteobacteria bacterium]|nr:hypothetical protein [Pseudomonadota bacterium]MBS0495296.1 hypothetical protein [Pseudomonadota bacterium]